MVRNYLLGLVAVLALSLPLAAQTVDELVAKNIQALGGMEKLQAQKTRQATGRLSLPDGLELPMTLSNKRPGMFRSNISIQGMDIVQAYDGKSGWQIDPTQGKKTAEPLSEEDLRDVEESADFDGPLVNYKEKGNKVELVGKDDVEGTPAYKLKVTLKNGDVKYIYLDADSYVEIKEESKRMIRGAEREFEAIVGDYKEEGGVMMPHYFEQKPKGAPQAQKLTIDKVVVNANLPDSYFQVPGATPAAAEKKDTTAGEKKPETKKSNEKKQDKPKP